MIAIARIKVRNADELMDALYIGCTTGNGLLEPACQRDRQLHARAGRGWIFPRFDSSGPANDGRHFAARDPARSGRLCHPAPSR